jgi:hypothetical protein
VEGPFNQTDLAPCPACGVSLQTEVFPALFRKASAGPSAEAILIDGESSCFYHPQKKAAVACDSCGRFLCALCDCPMQGQHFCTTCLQAGKSKGKIKSLENERTLYDSIALSLAILPLIIFYFSLLTAPLTLFVAIRYWKAPGSIVRRTKIRFIVAIFIALLEIAGWATLIIYLTTRHHARN